MRSVWLLALLALGARLAADPTPGITSESAPYPHIGSIERLDPALDRVLDPAAQPERLAVGFRWAEGPVWRPREGDLLFSDVPANTVYRRREGEGVSVFLRPSGDTGHTAHSSGEGSNGLALGPDGSLVLCQHGDRRLVQLTAGSSYATIVERFEGHRFNSPNDLCFDRAGNLFFTDPPYGLGRDATPELAWNGVYRRSADGTVTLLARDLERPNGLALSPDEKTLYVANSGDRPGMRTFLMAYTLQPDGTVAAGRVLFDAEPLRAKLGGGLMDGLKVDAHGNLWATGPGGVLILSPDGQHLGTIHTGTATANCCFGGPDGSTLFITANNLLLRLPTRTTSAR